TVRKKGRELIWDNVGTHDQVGSINVGFAAWRGAILGAINVLMLPGQMGCIGGAARLCKFDPEPGKITSPDWGAAVSPAGVYATETAVSLGNALVSKMMLASTDPQMRANAVTPDGAQWPCHFVAGDNQRGDYYVGGMGDNMLGGGSATYGRDGEFANGHFWIPEGRGPNVEAYEADWPILYLFRREHPDSGGAGRQRAGNGGEIAYVPHKGESYLGLYCNEGIPKTTGLFGGDPGSIMETRVVQGSDLRARFARGEMPQDLDELGGTEMEVAGKGDGFPVSDDDVLYWNWLAPGGYGDPLTRDPEAVLADVAAGAVSPQAADDLYAVKLDGSGGIDAEATAKLRERRLLERLRECGAEREQLAPPVEPAAEGAQPIGDAYLIDREAGVLRCHHCSTDLGPLAANAKERMAVLERPLRSLSPSHPDPAKFVDQEVVWRDYCCPGCGVRLATETAYPGEAPFQELRLD
ncbi:MAG TPA: hydantoinase B/oxoprolinase family protein, partial [Solirubrobacterales bacterium]|nr:hydantoinase B/oxoprolinase family protein [Solirubrobacterales bacterium]